MKDMTFNQHADKRFIVISVRDSKRGTRGGETPHPITKPHLHSTTNTITIIPAKTYNYQ